MVGSAGRLMVWDNAGADRDDVNFRFNNVSYISQQPCGSHKVSYSFLGFPGLPPETENDQIR